MKRYVAIVTLFLLVASQYTHAQKIFFESVGDTSVRFFFDENYYLVDQDCEFKAIERVAGFDRKNNKFDGEFKDFHVMTGHVVLHGNYREGKKEGRFTAYYPNGKLRWETTFDDDSPRGPWYYYFPDGTPHLFITLTEKSFSIDQMWDEKGEQIVVDGDGLYNLNSAIIGFTDHGYTSYNRTGEVRDSVTNGRWPITVLVDDKSKQIIGVEVYEGGRLVQEVRDKGFFWMYYGSVQSLMEFAILPNDYFPRAEFLIAKACTFDEFSGFMGFIETKFYRYLQRTRENFNIETAVNYRVRVSKKGMPRIRHMTTSSQELTAEQRRVLRKMVEEIDYYLPSYLDGKPIKDNLTVSFSVHWNEQVKNVSNMTIEREKGK
jgi:hypothetical protein